jgi:hypothetical protein
MTCVDDEIGSSACTPVATEGEPCSPVPCARDHYCRDEGGDQGVCRPDGELGDACDAPVDVGDYNTSCADGLYCMVSSTGTCLPQGALGEPCDTRNADSCQEELACLASMGSTCQPLGALGEQCNPVFLVACAEGRCACSEDATGEASCEEGACVALLELGAPCTESTHCASRFCNVFVSDPVCDEPLGLRDACVPPEE